MSAHDIWSIAGAILASVGGAGIIICAVSGFISERLAKRIDAKYEHRLNKELERYRTTLDERRHITKAQFDREFEIYHKLSKSFFSMIVKLSSFTEGTLELKELPKDNKTVKLDEFIRMVKTTSEAQDTLYENVAFLPIWRYKTMIKILFICHGNICRSPMAEFVMRDMVKKAGLSARIEVASAATSAEELGNGVYPPVKRLLAAHGINCAGKTARRITADDFYEYDLLVGMDYANLRNMRRICPAGQESKIKALLDYTDRPGEVADPWYTGDFEATWRDVQLGCAGLLETLK